MKTFTVYRPLVAQHGKHDENQMNNPNYSQFEGVVFSDGTCVLRWLTAKRSTSVWSSFIDMLDIHGHSEYGTYIIWENGKMEKYIGNGVFENFK